MNFQTMKGHNERTLLPPSMHLISTVLILFICWKHSHLLCFFLAYIISVKNDSWRVHKPYLAMLWICAEYLGSTAYSKGHSLPLPQLQTEEKIWSLSKLHCVSRELWIFLKCNNIAPPKLPLKRGLFLALTNFSEVPLQNIFKPYHDYKDNHLFLHQSDRELGFITLARNINDAFGEPKYTCRNNYNPNKNRPATKWSHTDQCMFLKCLPSSL